MTEKISNKIRAFVIDYEGNSTHTIPLDKITGLSKRGNKYSITAQGWQETAISEEVYEELLKYFEPVVIESREW